MLLPAAVYSPANHKLNAVKTFAALSANHHGTSIIDWEEGNRVYSPSLQGHKEGGPMVEGNTLQVEYYFSYTHTCTHTSMCMCSAHEHTFALPVMLCMKG